MVGREKLKLLNAKSKNCDKLKYKTNNTLYNSYLNYSKTK